MTPPRSCGPSPGVPCPVPELRAALLRLFLDERVRCDAATREAMRGALPPEAHRAIERARASDWLPLAWEIAMLRAVEARGGDEAVRAVAGEVGRVARDVPIFRTLLAATLGMLGRRREALVRFLFASMDLSMRNAGRRGAVQVVDRRVIRMTHEDIPADLWDRTVNLRNCGAIASLDLARPAPRVEVEWAEGATRAVYTLTWP